jgi:hypothetical protein
VADALAALLELPFRKQATKICVFVADAPPHGLPGQSDTYPKGSANGHDPIAIVHKLTRQEVIIYSVGKTFRYFSMSSLHTSVSMFLLFSLVCTANSAHGTQAASRRWERTRRGAATSSRPSHT